MTTEVIMCVYNGEKFLSEQLESLKNQTRPANYVKIFDDCSTDNSFNLISEFVKKNNIENWVVIQNNTNKGWRLNFYDALSTCYSDIIFFCDQDDIWHSDKIEKMATAMEADTRILTLSGLQYLIDSNGEKIKKNERVLSCGEKYNNSITKSGLYENLQALCWKSRIGCAMAIRREMKDLLIYFKRDIIFVHDMWAVNTASLFNGYFIINYPCIKYRIHEENASKYEKVSGLATKEAKTKLITEKKAYLQYLLDGINAIGIKDKVDKKEYKRLKRANRFFEKRCELMNKIKIFAWINLLKYIDLYIKYLGIRQYFADIADALNLRRHFLKKHSG